MKTARLQNKRSLMLLLIAPSAALSLTVVTGCSNKFSGTHQRGDPRYHHLREPVADLTRWELKD